MGEEEEPDRERDECEHDDERRDELERTHPHAPPAGVHYSRARSSTTTPTIAAITAIA